MWFTFSLVSEKTREPSPGVLWETHAYTNWETSSFLQFSLCLCLCPQSAKLCHALEPHLFHIQFGWWVQRPVEAWSIKELVLSTEGPRVTYFAFYIFKISHFLQKPKEVPLHLLHHFIETSENRLKRQGGAGQNTVLWSFVS